MRGKRPISSMRQTGLRGFRVRLPGSRPRSGPRDRRSIVPVRARESPSRRFSASSGSRARGQARVQRGPVRALPDRRRNDPAEACRSSTATRTAAPSDSVRACGAARSRASSRRPRCGRRRRRRVPVASRRSTRATRSSAAGPPSPSYAARAIKMGATPVRVPLADHATTWTAPGRGHRAHEDRLPLQSEQPDRDDDRARRRSTPTSSAFPSTC